MLNTRPSASRQERRAAAEERRRKLLKGWIERGQALQAQGKSVPAALEIVAEETESLIRQNPTAKHEIVQAWDEFCAAIRKTAALH